MRRGSMSQPPQMSDLNIVLLGPTGAGKSASGNTILGGDRKTFKEGYSFASETKICTAAQTEVDGQTINVIDIVGLPDTAVKITDVQTEIEQILQNTNIDVFLLVIKLDQTFTKEKHEAVKWIQDHFGAKVLTHTIVLFTHGDQLREPAEDYLSKDEALRSLVDRCSGGFHVFNNKDEDRSQVTELLKKTESLRRKNGYRRYTRQDYKETQKDLWLKKCDIFAVALSLGAATAVFARAALRRGAELGREICVLKEAGVGEAMFSALTSVAPDAGPATLIGAAEGAALLTVATCAALYFFARKYLFRENDESD